MERDILTLITKINDRNLQKRRESGLTVYALTSVVFLLAYHLVETILNLGIRSNFLNKITIMSLSFNVCFGFFIFYSFYSYYSSSCSDFSVSLKLIKRKNSKDSILENICLFSIFIIPFSFSTVIFILNISNLDWYLITINIIWLLIFIVIIKSHFAKKSQTEYEIIENKKIDSDRNLFGIIVYLFGFALIIIPIIYYFVNIKYFEFPKFGLIKTTCILIILPLIFLKIFELNKHDIKSNALEKLESDIYLNNLSETEIKKIIQDNYLGIGLINWIKNRQETINRFKDELINELSALKVFKDSISQIDETYTREIIGRKEELKMRFSEIDEKFKDFVDKEVIEIQSIINEYSFTEIEDIEIEKFIDLLTQVVKEIKTELEPFKD